MWLKSYWVNLQPQNVGSSQPGRIDNLVICRHYREYKHESQGLDPGAGTGTACPGPPSNRRECGAGWVLTLVVTLNHCVSGSRLQQFIHGHMLSYATSVKVSGPGRGVEVTTSYISPL